LTEVQALVGGEVDFTGSSRTTHEANTTSALADVVTLCYDAFELGASSGAKRPKGFQVSHPRPHQTWPRITRVHGKPPP
jgi:hypothetical protein